MTAGLSVADPRPRLAQTEAGWMVAGARCEPCGHPSPTVLPRCPRCGGEMIPANFGPTGTVWAHTTIHVTPAGERDVPYGLAYVHLDEGPRVLAHLDEDDLGALAIGTVVRLNGMTALGDVRVEVAA
jgi:hypothetical protein